MQIVGCEDRKDLRTVVSKSRYLRKVAKEYRLRNNQAICFTNKTMTRFRLVFKVNNALFMCVPEIDEQSQYSVYLKISDQLALLAGIKGRVKFDFLATYAKGRIKRQNKRKKAIARREKQITRRGKMPRPKITRVKPSRK